MVLLVWETEVVEPKCALGGVSNEGMKKSSTDSLADKDNVDVKEKLAHWQRFDSLSKPHSNLNGTAP